MVTERAVLSRGAVVCALLLGGCASVPSGVPAAKSPAEAAPVARTCPEGVPSGTRCLGGTDSAGAHYLIAVPPQWSGVLVLHAHGGPALGPPKMARTEGDLQRWSIMVRAGHAWAGTSYRQGGVAVREAAEDVERLRGIFRTHVARPLTTLLHGQSWGAGVAARAAEWFTPATVGEQPWAGVLLTSGVLGGGSRSYDVRTDLRVVYQALCANHPRPDEPAYPLNLGLPAGATLTRSELDARMDACLGLDQKPGARSAAQQARLDTLTRILRIPASSVRGHMRWATWHFQEITSKRTGGASPFGNIGVQYGAGPDGAPGDAALNERVARYAADPAAARRFADDTDPTGQIPVPVLTVKWIGDPTAFVELDHTFHDTMVRAGTASHLVQTFTRTGTHSYLSDPTYPTLIDALLRWVRDGVQPTPASIAGDCPARAEQFGPGCSFAADYRPAALSTRVPERERP